ncbi:MAG TPA: esterase-like activity of phytase family protein [Kofleriaceae bacterium]
MTRWLVVALAACSKPPPPDTSRFEAVPIDTPPGVSDLSLDDRGMLWAIPERDHFVLEIALPGGAVTRHPLDGVPAGVDTESLTWLGAGRFAIGTEGQDVATASVLYAEQRGDRVTVTRELPLHLEGVVAITPNHGAEGLCGRGDDLLVGIESTGKLADGTRFAPLVHLHGKDTTIARLRLTTATGKVSALACTFAADGSADVYAIERHYGVSRILHFGLPAQPADITPTVVVDLDAIFHGAFNLEGIARLPDGRFVLVNDNQGRTIVGPTELFFLR